MKRFNNINYMQKGIILLTICLFITVILIIYGELPGDINNDGVINVLDKALLRDHFLERITLNEDQLARADVNEAGVVNIADMVTLAGLYEGGAGSINLSLSPVANMELVPIPPGSFIMGSPSDETGRQSHEGPRRTVSINYAFYLGKYVVTKEQWTAVMGTSPWQGQQYVITDPNSPAVYISWEDITKSGGFLDTFNGHLADTFQDYEVRLPSEAEWEYAIRAGTRTMFYWGDVAVPQINSYAWYFNNTINEGRTYAHVVGQKTPNAWGLFDMAGNIWERCEDDYHENYINAPRNGSAWVDDPRSSTIIFRGGSYATLPVTCRSAHRLGIEKTSSSHSSGFRIVAVPK